ncbi:MAG: tetraacyldisaccharide 4'-kinase [Planctomycetota bacterium]|nr:tetraacyldisaccharide 4'-kinase [Planctomycetota bacterium]
MSGADRRERPPLPLAVGAVLEPVYRLVVARRNASWDAGRGVERLGAPVISVGNLSVGGTGKTPMVMRMVRWLLEEGARPAIGMRGYAAPRGGESDEESEYRERFGAAVPVVARRDRAAGLRPLLAAGAADCVVLDDGFQHRRIAREMDIVLLDASRDVFADRCLPAGWLREPVESLRRATHVVVTHTERASAAELERLRERVERVCGRGPSAESRHEWTGLVGGRGGESERLVEWLRGSRVVAACGIGHPGAFLSGLERAGAEVVARVVRADHHAWSAADARELEGLARRERAGAVVVTEKDWSKLRRVWTGGVDVLRPRLELSFDRGEAALRESAVRAAGCGARPVQSGR